MEWKFYGMGDDGSETGQGRAWMKKKILWGLVGWV